MRRALTAAALAVALGASPRSVAAQPGPSTLSVADVVRSTERHFPLITAAERDRDVADAELLAAQGGFDPLWRSRVGGTPVGYYNPLVAESTITQPTTLWGAQLFAGWRYGQGLSYTGIPVYDGRLETADAGELRAGLTVPLWRNGPIDRARANVRRAEHGRTAASLGVAQQRLESLRTAAQRYWEWAAAGQRHAIAVELLALATARDAGLGERVARGDLPEFERADNARAVLQREGAVTLARRQMEQAAIELSFYLRDGRGAPRVAAGSELPGALPEPSPLDARCLPGELRAAEARRPEPRRLAALRERERVEQDYQENQSRPAVDVTVAASQDLGAGPQRLTTPAFEASVVLEIPLLNRGPVGRARAAGAAGERIEAQRRLALDRVTAEVRDAASALEAARERATFAGREAGLARELAGRERDRLRLGDGTLLVLNLREIAAAEAAVREVDARLDWQRAAVALRFAVGLTPPAPAPCVVAAAE